MSRSKNMMSPSKKQPEAVADKVLKRAEVGKMARRLQSRLALAQFKTKRGWEDLSLDVIEPKFEEELRQHKAAIRRKRLADGEILSDSSSSASDLPYPTRALMSSPLKAPLFSDAIGSSNGSTGHRKRTYLSTFENDLNFSSSPAKRYRLSPTAHKSFPGHHVSWSNSRNSLVQSSPLKPRRQTHFKTSTGPDVSFFPSSTRLDRSMTTPNFAVPDEDDDDLLPSHSFQLSGTRSSPPTTPVMGNRRLAPRNADKNGGRLESRDEGAELLLYMKSSPTPAGLPPRSQMEPPSTPPPKHLGFTPQAMATPNLDNPLFPHTPGQAFNFADYLNMTPSPAQKTWKTPIGLGSAKTPRSVARRHLAFDQAL
ncbi:hypothetical protein M406DRAFT_48815 [Cryphonectria parasitica EP155]|uniref:Cyclin-dependent kinase n=1 Tax=Cryphonectria parasitica (strain ATCC 38755 / EP155) TaxID=660469 RepID=A0A9P4XZH8_CRYP1|nr:uncharacterized protein M406DRAFT_48815 [Cryphonectria parasitica EP155]KAF3763632.1 hypothetical protein M406DRAFT_48815 [Cryphonectria parasitica EP155]